jgi:hypothetical protein
MPAPLDEGNDGDTIELRVYIKVSKRGHPELASLLAGLSKREQSRLLSALVFRGAMVSAQPVSVATMQVATAPTACQQTGVASVIASVQGTSELMDGFTADDMDRAFEFAMGAPAIANP